MDSNLDLSPSSLFSVKGLVAVITGGGSGIGLSLARALHSAGASKIYILGRRLSVLQDAATSIDPAIVTPIQCDVTDQASLLAAVKIVEKEMGYINLLIANAGMMGPRPLPITPSASASIEDYRDHALLTPMADFSIIYNVNVTSVYYTSISFLSLLSAGNTHPSSPSTSLGARSQIIATSSIASFSRLSGSSFAYNSSKAALTHLMKMMGTAFVPFRIRCNVLAPGLVESELASGIIASLPKGGGGDGKEGGSSNGAGPGVDEKVIPAGRIGNEGDIAGAVLYMASRAGAYLNGSVLVVDGGRLGILPSTY
ncbi:hypothetical protein DE146DRAFT_176791 [Phaeosphaeria sp. MPI-PUGE-AT-0046c]|nr:hypothetical protein DE146DRAFT_176791 [Phaeosphaeria sp. MPI-PUGE-AT-0046c]